MDKQESLALYAKGRDAWNRWAEERLTEKEELEKGGRWVDSDFIGDMSAEMKSWINRSNADFCGHQFEAEANFSEFVFPGKASFTFAVFIKNAYFTGCTFAGYASFTGANFLQSGTFGGSTFHDVGSFDHAIFSGGAVFNHAVFCGPARFQQGTICRDAQFKRVKFSELVEFHSARFSCTASFKQCTFEGWTSFDNVVFEQEADFEAVRSGSAFSVAGTIFARLPSFVQAHFDEAPLLQNLRIEPTSGAKVQRPQALLPPRPLLLRPFRALRRRLVGDAGRAARWRALKRIAIQGHDHQQELAFFKGELQEMRGSVHTWRHAPFWFGWFYQWLSDFGRSIARPFWIWLASVFGFAAFYLWYREPAEMASSLSSCTAGTGRPWFDALMLSLRKGLVFLGAGPSERQDQIYACLFGTQTDELTQPIIPALVDLVGLLQTLLSAALIFLFLLAIRNHFRIR